MTRNSIKAQLLRLQSCCRLGHICVATHIYVDARGRRGSQAWFIYVSRRGQDVELWSGPADNELAALQSLRAKVIGRFRLSWK